MAGDLDLKVRISAELDQFRKALDSISSDLAATGSNAQSASKGFDGLQRELNETNAKASKATGTLNTLQGELAQTGSGGRKAGQDAGDGFSNLASKIEDAKRALAGYLTFHAAVGAVKGIANLTDSYAQYNAQLKLATSSQEELATAQAEIYRIAQTTKAPIADVASTYATLDRATKTLGKSQAEIINVLETVNKAISLTPVSAETAKDTLVQFGQAFGGDFKSGAQELNSILEQTPGLAQAIADGLGVNVSELKKMGEEGELSGRLIFDALASVSGRVDELAKELPTTVGGALTKLQNDIVQTFGSADTSQLTDAIEDMRKTLTDPAISSGLSTLAAGLLKAASYAAKAAAEVANFTKWVGEELASKLNGPALDDIVRLKEKIDELGGALGRLEKGDAFSRWLNANRIKEYRTELEKLQAAYDALQQGGETAKQNAEQKAAAREQERKDLALQAGEEIKAEQETIAREKAMADQRQKSIASTIDSLAEQAATYGKNTEETVKYQLEQKQATKEEIDRAVALAKQVDALKAAEEAEKTRSRTTAEAALEAKRLAEERQRDEEKLAKALEDINIRVLQLSGQAVESRALALSAQYDPVLEQLKQKGDKAGVELVNRLINLELAKTRLDELKDKVSDALKELQDAEQSIDARVSTGEISQAQGAQELEVVRADSLQNLREYAQELAVLEAAGIPGATEQLDILEKKLETISQQGATGTAAAIKNLRAQLNEFQQNLATMAANAGVDAMTNFFMDIATGAKSAKDALKDFVASFAQSIAQMMARALAMYAVLQILNAIPGGSAVAAAMDVGAKVKHAGGVIGRGGTVRNVPSFVFAGAPRYHSGGVAGLKPGEVPAILQTGEEVLARNDPRNVVNGGGQQQSGGVRILNVVDPSLVSDFMSSSAGEEVIVNAISRNAGAIKQVLV